jgi:hypothetical protein
MTLAEYIQNISERIGIDNADEALKAIVTNPALSSISIPQHIVSGTNAKLMTEDEAKYNPTVKKHFTGTALNTIDIKIKDVLDEYNFDDETKTAILSETSTYNRIPLLAKAIADVREKAISATGGEKKALLDKVQELQQALNVERESRRADLDKVNSQWQSQLTDKELQGIFNGYDYALDLDKDVTITTARNLWEKKLRDKGGKYVYTNEGLKLVSAEHPDLPFTIDNKPVELRTFTDSVLAEARMLKVKGEAQPAPGPVPTPMPVNKPIAPAAKTQTSKALADFKAGSSLV